MGKKKPDRIRHIPQRTCVGCRMVTSKRSLIRLVKTENGITIDPTGKMAGRGVYLHAFQDCWKKGLKGSIAKGLKTDLSVAELRIINDFMATLPENDGQIIQIDTETNTVDQSSAANTTDL